jgi:hypothetical protein
MKIPSRLFRVKTVDYLLSQSMLCFLLMVTSTFLFAENNESTYSIVQQDIIIEGTIVGEQGIPLIGATVIRQGTSKGAFADFDGRSSLKIDVNSIIEISYVGFKTKVIENVTSAMSHLSFQMETDARSLSEIVIVKSCVCDLNPANRLLAKQHLRLVSMLRPLSRF